METFTCQRCETEIEAPTLPLGWSLDVAPAGPRHLCGRCTRDHVRDIEAKLDERWW